MKTSEILTMTIQEFENELTQSNLEFVKEKYITIANALHVYQEGAILSNEEEYLNINEYLDIVRVQDENAKDIDDLMKSLLER